MNCVLQYAFTAKYWIQARINITLSHTWLQRDQLSR